MSDFFQTGEVMTLHRLGDFRLESLEQQVEYFAQHQPIALVLPALYAEFERPAIHRILKELSAVRYVRQFVVALAKTSPEQLRDACERLAVLPGEVRVIWNDGPRVQHLYNTLEENGLHVGPDG
jgi:glucosyl-3-phosphoglycerate synthase